MQVNESVKVINQASGNGWHLYNADCIEGIAALPDNSVHYSVFSPPFSSLFVYSDSERDMGNSENDEEFFEHFGYLVGLLYQKIMPGRLVSVHCMNLPSTIQHNGYIGIRDFRGGIIKSFVDRGWVYHSEVCIWKDPVVAMQRTKALGLLHKQVKKDSCMSRMGIPDYVCTFRKPGKNDQPVSGPLVEFHGDQKTFSVSGDRSIDIWQRYASPVWDDINQSDTLNGRMARENGDDRHVCPLQLGVIARCLQLWTNPGDIVLSPFAGIASEGYQSLLMGRRFIGYELKGTYFKAGCGFLAEAEKKAAETSLFDNAELTA